MKCSKQWILNLLLVGALALPAAEALARKREGGQRGGMMKELNLTAEQKQKMQELRSGDREKMQNKRKEMQAARDALDAAMKGNASEKEIWGKFDDLQKVQAKFAKERFEKVMEIRSLLTPEQRAKFRGSMGKGMGEGKDREHRGKNGRRGARDNNEDDGEE